MAADAYFIVTGSAQAVRDFDWISRHIPPDADAVLTDVTSGYAVLGVMGPASRELLSRVTTAQLSSAAFPYGTMQEIIERARSGSILHVRVAQRQAAAVDSLTKLPSVVQCET
ncbi:MAG: hypothetical protein EX260_10580, partial [Desulfobulbaceae bacterium]